MKKRSNKNTAILIFTILIISITTGYALLEENVQIIGKANIKTGEDNEGKYIVTYTIENKWKWTNKSRRTWRARRIWRRKKGPNRNK